MTQLNGKDMTLLGEDVVKFYEPSDEKTHQPGRSLDWQESAVIFLTDPEQDIHAYLRMGQEPNRPSTGIGTLWTNLWVGGEHYVHYEMPALRSGDRFAEGWKVGDTCRYSYDGRHYWEITNEREDVYATFAMEDYHQGCGFWPEDAGTLKDDCCGEHIEASGKVTGTVAFRGKKYALSENAVGHRDHSWGDRKWEIMRGHRWIPAIFGRDLSMIALAWVGADGSLAKFGFIRRGSEIMIPKQEEIDIVVYAEIDGLSVRGGEVTFNLESGEILQFKYEKLARGGTSFQHGYPAIDMVCSVSHGDRRTVGCLEVGFNAMGGSTIPNPRAIINGLMINGVHPY
jgi:hypothetical protein